MTRLAIVVEGETEEEFINNLLTPHLYMHEVSATPHSIGGNVTVERLASEMARYLWSYDQVTSLVDFYGFRNKGDASREDLQRRIFQQVDAQIGVSWDQSRVLPYVQQYEFEALLFSGRCGLQQAAERSARLDPTAGGDPDECLDAGRHQRRRRHASE